mmetsp:Transcript_32063/g.53650  ORF Transcript_32063/g.53650 Transcript_32063/m.53650 type:complete len:297 (-) Transcript_32063:270-1160(-)
MQPTDVIILASNKDKNGIFFLQALSSNLFLESSSDLRVQHQDKSSSDGTKSVGTSSLEHSGDTFVLDDLLEAIHGSCVDPLFLGLLRLHLKTTTDSVEWVGGISGSNGGSLGAGEFGCGTEESIFVLLVRVVTREGIEETEVDTTVRDDTNDGNTDTVVKARDTGALDGLYKTVNKTVELLLSCTDVGSKTGTSVIQRVHDHEGTSSRQTSRGHVNHEEFPEFSVLVSLGEHELDGILEGKVEGLGREVTNDVGQVTTPESADSLFGSNTSEAVDDTSVSGDFSADNLGVGILGLD